MTENGKKRLLYLIIFLIFIVSVFSTNYIMISNDVPVKDAGEYLLMAYNFEKYGTFSLETRDIPDPEPTAYREPVFPAYMAFCILINPAINNMDRETLFKEGNFYIKVMQIPVLLILSFLVFYIVFLITKNPVTSFITLFLVGTSMTLSDTVSRLLSENISALLIILTAIFFYKLITQKKIIFFILSSISLGILILDKAVFLYFIFIAFIFLLIYYLKTKFCTKKIFITGLLIFILTSSIIPGAWMARNYYHFGHFALTGRGGIVLLVRAEKNLMTPKEYLASFFYWSPSEKVRTLILSKILSEKDYERLDRSNKNSFYYQVTRVELGVKNVPETNTISPEYTTFEKDSELRKKAIDLILKHPIRHILAIPQFVWRGLFPESGFLIDLPGSTEFKIANNNILNLFISFSFFYMFIFSIRKKMWNLFAFLLPGIYLFSINSLMTHNIARYSAPIIPVLIISTVLFFYFRLKQPHSHSIKKTG